MIGHSLSRSGWLPLLGALGFGMWGCITGPAPEEETLQVDEELSLAGLICGGPRNLSCRKTDYCATPANTCPGPKQAGICRRRPQICPDIFAPVCGCDGKTYSNSCRAAAAGASVAHPGECSKPGACTSNSDCAAGSYCASATCGGAGSCAVKPEVCIQIFNPVCGCDGRTYSNSCVAAAAGVNVASAGECPPVQACAGFLGLPCPGGGRCVDDPSDDCDPANGGADCGGICLCVETMLCIQGFHFDSSPQVCACVPDAPVSCGNVTCPTGQVCCNASCSICTPPGFACIQIACQ